MKAYVVHNASPLTPFKKSASELSFRHCTVASRLKVQLAENSLKVVSVDALDITSVKPRSIVVQDDMFVSDSFLALFLKAIPDKRKNYQCMVETSHFSGASSVSPESAIKKMPLFYYGEPSTSEILTDLMMTPEILFTVAEGMPPSMHIFKEMRIHMLEFYALQIKYWFDLQTASTLYCRDFVTKMIRPAKFLPKKLVERAMNWKWMVEQGNSIGKNCHIHPTAILEGCVIGDNVSIGAYSYLRSSVIGDNTVLSEYSKVKMSYVGERAYIAGTDLLSCYIGDECSIITPILYHAVFGQKSFVSGGSGFADFNMGASAITATIKGEDIPTGLDFIASCVGENCFIGANMIFSPGKVIPDNTHLLDNGLIKNVPAEDGTYVLSGNKFLQIPNSFLGK